MARIAIIAGSGAAFYPQPGEAKKHAVANVWGSVAGGIAAWREAGHEILFLSRHGEDAQIPPHRVNYRANVQALRDHGADWVVALNAVGGISPACGPGTLVLPDQLIDYTWGREHTFYAGDPGKKPLEFIDFTEPYSVFLRQKMLAAMAGLEQALVPHATYGATQGPRLETAAEINRLERDGCDIVGMTGMPEAALARELGLHYASCCFVVNWAAGRSPEPIHAGMDNLLQQGQQQAAAVIRAFIRSL